MKVKCWGDFKPKRGTASAAGIDLYNNGLDTVLRVNEPYTINTKVSMEIPPGYVGLVFVRSSVGKRRIGLINQVGVIDSDYRGEILVNLVYTGDEDTIEIIEHGERFAQIIIVPHYHSELEFVDELSTTKRGAGGFGSTGTK